MSGYDRLQQSSQIIGKFTHYPFLKRETCLLHRAIYFGSDEFLWKAFGLQQMVKELGILRYVDS